MKSGKLAVVLLGILATFTGPNIATAQAESTSPWLHLESISRPGNLPEEAGATGQVVATLINIGDGKLDGSTTPLAIADTLPQGLTATSAKGIPHGYGALSSLGPVPCTLASSRRVQCSFTGSLAPYQQIEVVINVTVQPGAASGEENEVEASGAGAPTVQLSRPLTFSESTTPFGVADYRLTPEEVGGGVARQAGSHPFQLTTTLALNQILAPDPSAGGKLAANPVSLPKDLGFQLPAGLVGNPLAYSRCTVAQFLNFDIGAYLYPTNECPSSSVVGVASVLLNEEEAGRSDGELLVTVPIYNLTPAAGEPARFGLEPAHIPVLLDTSIRSGNGEDYGVSVHASNLSQQAGLLSSTVTFWGTPGDPRHDPLRGTDCILETEGVPAQEAGGITYHAPCENSPQKHPAPLLSLPTACGASLQTTVEADSWAQPGSVKSFAPSEPTPSLTGCGLLPFSPQVGSEPTSDAATTGTGLNFDLGFDDEGLRNPEGLVESQSKKAVVTLPQGFTANPSLAAGLKACTLAEYLETGLKIGGCTEESKIGDVTIESPLVEPKVLGGLYVAKQGENPYGNLLTLYLIARNPELGVLVKQALKVTPNPVTGQLTTEVDQIPQLPFSKFHLAFRSGQRSPLITPPSCGPYAVSAFLSPWSVPSLGVGRESSFQITQGPEGLPCPSGGLPPFHPELEAGTLNNAAGTFSAFYARITRKDSEQEITHFSIKLPPGVIGKLAGVAQCSDAQIAKAKAREHEGGGAEEEADPSCPAASQVGTTTVGTGVGNVLAYAPGKLYLAGPYHGAPISIVSVTAAKVGPFDLGTVVVRVALRVNPETAEVFVDATGSDPIPHIVDGIPTHLRDIRIRVDRPEFVLNPTSCAPTSTASTVLGSGLDFASEADDNPVTVSSRFQAADCAALGFKPKIAFSLKGGTKRSQFPAFKAVVRGRPGDANIASSEVVLPKSEILAQEHIGTSCTRVQFNEGAGNGAGCPANSIYGRARAVTPLLSEPLEGPVYLRSNGGEGGRKVPDLVAALHGQEINIDLAGFIDSVLTKNKRGETVARIRTRFETVPDAQVSKFTLEMFGGKKGLLVNSQPLCKGTHRAEVNFTAHNGKVEDLRPALKTSCAKNGKGKRGKKGAKGRAK